MPTYTTTARAALRWLTGSNLVKDVDAGFQALAEDVDATLFPWQLQLSCSQSIPSGAATTLTWTTEVHDPHSVITVPASGVPISITGVYIATLKLDSTSAADYGVSLYRDLPGPSHDLLIDQAVPSMSTATITAIGYCSSADTIKVDLAQASGGAITVAAKLTMAFLGYSS